MRKRLLNVVIAAVVMMLLFSACHRADKGDESAVPSGVTPTEKAEISAPVPVTDESTAGTEPSSAAMTTDSPIPTETESMATAIPTEPESSPLPVPTGSETAVTATPAPTQVPYEGYVIGKDVNNNELKMTPQEADEFVMAGNILKLYDGSWFDIDDDGEPEYVSIQPYGHWEEKNGKHQYVVEKDGTIEILSWMPDWWKEKYEFKTLSEINVSGYESLVVDKFLSNDYEFLANARERSIEKCIYVVSLDKKNKQMIIRATIYSSENSTCIPCVVRIENDELIFSGWLGCEIEDFMLSDDLTFDATLVTEGTLGFMRIRSKNYFDGISVKTKAIGVDMNYYSEPLIVYVDQLELTALDGTAYENVYKGESLELERVEILNPDDLSVAWNERNRTAFDGYPRLKDYSLAPIPANTNYRLFVKRVLTGEKYYVDDIKGIFYDKDLKPNSSYCFFTGYYKGQ